MALLDGKVAIVTGAGRGIGRAHALALAAHGAKVVVNDLGASKDGLKTGDTARADGVVEEIRKTGGEAVASYDSVADYDAAERIINTALEAFDHLDILVNNAGIFQHGFIEEMTEDDFDRIIGTHLKGTFNTCRHAFPIMKAQRYGRIINTVSNQWPAPKVRAVYSAAKGGIASLTWDLALEGRAFGITANALSPFAATGGEATTETVRDRDRALVALGILGERRMLATEERGSPEYVSPIVVYLASDQGASINGRIFRAGAGKIGLYGHPVEIRQIHRDVKDGPWPVEQLIELMPNLMAGEELAPHLL